MLLEDGASVEKIIINGVYSEFLFLKTKFSMKSWLQKTKSTTPSVFTKKSFHGYLPTEIALFQSGERDNAAAQKSCWTFNKYGHHSSISRTNGSLKVLTITTSLRVRRTNEQILPRAGCLHGPKSF